MLDSFANVDYLDIDRQGIINRIANYDGLVVRLNNTVDRAIINKAHRLKAIATATTATNHIDETAANERQIKVISLKGERRFLNSVYSTAEHTFGLILALLRKIPSAQADVFKGRWRNDCFRGRELYGKTLGIIGFGRLGQMVARIARGFQMKIFAYDTKKDINYPAGVRKVSLDRLLTDSDIVSLHIPLGEQTKGFMSEQLFKKMRKGSYLVNTSRGAILDEDALVRRLKMGHLAGAAVDVLTGEEKPGFRIGQHPLVKYAKTHNNLIITPHIGGAALEAIEKTDIFIAQKLGKFFQDK